LPAELAADGVLVAGYLLYDPGSQVAARTALTRASASVVAVEASSWPLLQAYGSEPFFEATSPATLLLANEREAEVLFGRDVVRDPKGAVLPYRWVCIKRGARGAVLVGEGQAIEASAPTLAEPIDPTGA